MVSFYGLALGNAGDYRRELLSCTVFEHLSLAVEAAGPALPLGWVWASRRELEREYAVPNAFQPFMGLALAGTEEE